jgi:hypothetical protein
VTFFGLMLTPLFYVLVRKLSRRALTNNTGSAPIHLAQPLSDETG